MREAHTVYECYGVKVLERGLQETQLRDPNDALDLIGEALRNDAAWVLIPVEQLDESFFRLQTRVAGEILQKFVNYRLKVAICGDVARWTETSKAFHDFVYESNGGNQLWFVANREEFETRLQRRAL